MKPGHRLILRFSAISGAFLICLSGCGKDSGETLLIDDQEIFSQEPSETESADEKTTEEEAAKENFLEVPEVSDCGSDRSIHRYAFALAQDEKYVYYEKDIGENSFLWYADKATGMTHALCTKEDCRHQDLSCMAVLPPSAVLYGMEREGKELQYAYGTGSGIRIFSIDLENCGYQERAFLSDSSVFPENGNGYNGQNYRSGCFYREFYFFNGCKQRIKGMLDPEADVQVDSYEIIYAVNLQDGREYEVLGEAYEGYGYVETLVRPAGDKLYLITDLLIEAGEEEEGTGQVHRLIVKSWDLYDQTTEELFDGEISFVPWQVCVDDPSYDGKEEKESGARGLYMISDGREGGTGLYRLDFQENLVSRIALFPAAEEEEGTEAYESFYFGQNRVIRCRSLSGSEADTMEFSLYDLSGQLQKTAKSESEIPPEMQAEDIFGGASFCRSDESCMYAYEKFVRTAFDENGIMTVNETLDSRLLAIPLYGGPALSFSEEGWK